MEDEQLSSIVYGYHLAGLVSFEDVNKKLQEEHPDSVFRCATAGLM